jgi:hypothetical protein
MTGPHPARALDRIGLTGLSRRLRDLRWAASEVAPTLAPAHIGRIGLNWAREPIGRRAFRVLNEEELMATRRSDLAFVFGSGRSLVDIAPEEWARIGEHDVIGFSHFHRQDWVRVDYHLVAEVPSVDETAASIRANPRYANTVIGLMHGWMAEASNEIVARRLLPQGTRIFRWRRVGRDRGHVVPPTSRLADGLVHGVGSIQDVVNFALVLGWRRIVIAGVDLYNKEYFWLPPNVARPDEKPEFTAASRWPQAEPLIETMAVWRDVAARRGIDLFVHDPRSLLGKSLPTFRW